MINKNLIPQQGFQYKFLSSPADIVIGGGKAGSGKSMALLMDPLRYINTVPGFGAVIFRRTVPMITGEGGLRDTSNQFYPIVPLISKQSTLTRVNETNGNKIKFSHMEYEKDALNRQGSQIPLIGFDELTHFTSKQFWYLVGRNRSTCGVKPYVRATCNPDPDSRVAQLIDRWIDPTTGYIIRERDGVIRYFVRSQDQMVRGDTKKEVLEQIPHITAIYEEQGMNPMDMVLSFTFIEGDIYDNKELLTTNPSYLGNLLAQDEQTKSQLLDGNWHIKQDNLALGDYKAINDLFSNYLPENGSKKYITTDVARFGRDLTVVGSRTDRECTRIDVLTRSKTTETTSLIEERRKEDGVMRSNVLVDQDGVGGGVVDEGGYTGFSGGGPVIKDPRTKEKENYSNQKTQFYYRLFDKINAGSVKITETEIYVDGSKTSQVQIGGKRYNVVELIKKDLRAIKKLNPDSEGKKRINTKDMQKIILAGRSPDFGDMIMMRVYYDFKNTEIGVSF